MEIFPAEIAVFHADGRRDMNKLVVAFRRCYDNAP